MFELSDIKAGYLLSVTNIENNDKFNMTVVPGLYNAEDSDLGCCCPGYMWFPLHSFDDDLRYSKYRVDRVFGLTVNRYLLDNNPAQRELLWDRSEDEVRHPVSQHLANEVDQKQINDEYQKRLKDIRDEFVFLYYEDDLEDFVVQHLDELAAEVAKHEESDECQETRHDLLASFVKEALTRYGYYKMP